jgi:hypothetical protein
MKTPPYDEIFRGVRSYEEVQGQIPNPAPRSTSWFYQLSKAQVK